MSLSWKKSTLPVLIVLVSLSTIAFFRWENSTNDSSKINKVTVHLGWLPNANSAGQIVAFVKGYYREQGLGVTLLPGGLVDTSIQAVASGEDLLGFANSPDLVIRAISAGAPLRIIAVIQQEGFHAFMSRKEKGITSPENWIGKKIGVKYASPTFLYYQMILHNQDIDRKKIREIPLKYDVKPFLEDDIDVYPGAITNEGIKFEEMGLVLSFIKPSDYGISTCGNVLFTSEKALTESSEIIQRFVDATLKGWAFCLEPSNMEEVMTCFKAYSTSLDIEKERKALQKTTVLVGDGILGGINVSKLNRIIEGLITYGLINEDLNAERVVDKRFIRESRHE
jgi:ABC-type nitrate/sulfonate/bicarbonate transport system substrate-binding protein